MGLAERQAALARLYTRAADRERFAAEPEAAGHLWGLSDDDIRWLQAASESQIGALARSLVAKRRGEVAKLLPLTVGALDDAFPKRFAAYAANQPTAGGHRHQSDAIAFARHLDNSPGEAWIADISRYESAWLDTEPPLVRILRFQHDIRPIRTGHPLTTAPAQRHTVALIVRARRHAFVAFL